MRIAENNKIKWGARLPKQALRRLYASDAAGLTDEELLEEAGWTLYERCSDILYVNDFQHGHFRCPKCESKTGCGAEMTLAGDVRRDDLYRCPVCGFAIARSEMRERYRKQQLNPGGAVPFFQKFMVQWQRAASSAEKMLAVDAVIHSFHYSLKQTPDAPTRAAGVNLIEGHLYDVVTFLDELSAGRTDEQSEHFRRELAKNQQAWGGWFESQQTMRKSPEIEPETPVG